MAIFQFFCASLPKRLLGVALALLVSIGCLALVGSAMDPLDCRMAPNVTIGSEDVAGMTLWEAHSALETALEQTLYQQDLSVMLPEETLVFSPEDTGIRVKIWKALWDAYRCGRDEDQVSKEIPLLPYIKVNEETIRSALTAYAAQYDTTLTQPTWQLEGEAPSLSTDSFNPDSPSQYLTVTMGIPELHLDVDQVYGEILATYSQGIASCRAGSFSVTPEVTLEALPEVPDAKTLYAQFCAEPVNDSLDMENYVFVPGSYGHRFDAQALQNQIDTAQPGETINVKLEFAEPETLGDEVYFREILGAYETRHTDNENRNTNLRLLCAALDGHILQPGEEFSFNGVVGERTKERGYKPAPAYSGNRLINDYGGGVCQGSTTLYNCVLLADLEVIFRACHGASVGYVPAGLDASVNYLTTDFQFRNSFHFPIKLQAEVADGYVKMQILGTDEKDYYIKMETRSGDDDIAVYARSYKCKYDKETDELISRELEAFSTYYKSLS